jgi:hypothetical protein
MAILVIMNNYLHDLATAVFAVSAVAALLLRRSAALEAAPRALGPVVTGLYRVGLFALAWTLVAGMFRGLTYQRYEYWEAARYAQADVPGLVPALVLKHLVLVALVALGVVALVRLRRLGTRLVAAPEG